jgi:endoglucanase
MRVLLPGLVVSLVLFSYSVHGQAAVVLNQLGFYVQASKLAVVILPAAADSFYIVTHPAGDTAFSGRLGQPVRSANSSLSTRLADFSVLNKEGSYILVVPGLPHSRPFTVGKRVLEPAAVAALKGYYYQRASMALEPVYAGYWARAAGHPDRVVFCCCRGTSGRHGDIVSGRMV